MEPSTILLWTCRRWHRRQEMFNLIWILFSVLIWWRSSNNWMTPRQRDLYGTKAEMVMAEVAAASGGSQSLQQLSHRGSKFNLTGGSGSGGSGAGMKTKWMKAFRTLTNSSSSQNVASSSSLPPPGPCPSVMSTSNNQGSGSDTLSALSSTMKNSREYEKYVHPSSLRLWLLFSTSTR